MSKYHCLLFEEHVPRAFPGFEPLTRVYDLPIWGNFTIGNVARLSDASSMQHTITAVKDRADIENLKQFLSHGTDAQTIIVGRSGNLTVVDWNLFFSLKKTSNGIGKIHLGRDPSDLYMMPRRKLREIIQDLSERVEKGKKRFCSLLFDEYLFRHFDRIVNLEGYSFLMRNCYEYWRENLNLISALRNERFLALYMKLQSPHDAKSSVTESGALMNSFVGCGCRVKGVVENSIIFHNVDIGKNTRIRGSVVLPYNTVEDGVVIENALILEGRDRVIERNSVIGGFMDVHNREYPELLRQGLSIVGQSVHIPRNTRIGAACLVASKGEKKLPASFVMHDGTSYRV
jgi:hypothetical protein